MFFFFKLKTAYEMRISDWSSDVCSSDLGPFLYGVSAFSLLALVFGKTVPVTHHITLTAALTAGVVAGHTSEPSLILLAAVGAGLVASVFAEVWARLMLERCKVHLDPPAAAIAIVATFLALLQPVKIG